MRRYEVVFVLVPTMNDDECQQTLEVFKAAAEEMGARIVNVDEWGMRKLAYRINNHSEGIYTIFTLEEPAATAVTELERRFRVSDSVIRFLSIRVDQDLKRAKKFKARREDKKQTSPEQPVQETAQT